MPADVSIRFHGMIREARAAKSLSQEEVARRADVSLRSYQRIEAGEISPRLDIFFRILNTIGVNPRDILLEEFKKDLKVQSESNVDLSSYKSWINAERKSPMLVDALEIEGLKKALTSEYERGLEKIGYWEWNVDTQEFYWSSQMYKVYGMDPGQPYSHAEFYSRLIPSEIKIMEKSLAELISDGTTYQSIHTVLVGEEKFKVKATAKIYRNQEGQRVIFGTAERMD